MSTSISTTSANASASNKEYPKYPVGVYLHDFSVERVSWDTEVVRQATKFIKDGKAVELEEAWGIVPKYTYDDGKTDKLVMRYPGVRCRVMIKEGGAYGKTRQLIQTYDRNGVHHLKLKEVSELLVASAVEHIVTHDCSSAMPSTLKVSIPVSNDDTKDVSYSEYITQYLSEVKNGKPAGVTTIKLQDKFRREVAKMCHASDLLYDSGDASKHPVKFSETTKYPTKQPGTDAKPEEIEKYERQLVEGVRKLYVFSSPNMHVSFPEIHWIKNKKGTGYYTTDYHLLIHPIEGKDPVLGVDACIKCIVLSVSKKGVASLRIKEDLLNANFCITTPSRVIEREDKRIEQAMEEFNGLPPVIDSSQRDQLFHDEDV